LGGPSTPVERHSTDSLDSAFEAVDFRIRAAHHQVTYHSSDESYLFDYIMEKVKSTKFAHLVEKLAVKSEPGLTNAQLMYGSCSVSHESWSQKSLTDYS
jgi:NCS1 family nucleobase:cation symporter-1